MRCTKESWGENPVCIFITCLAVHEQIYIIVGEVLVYHLHQSYFPFGLWENVGHLRIRLLVFSVPQKNLWLLWQNLGKVVYQM